MVLGVRGVLGGNNNLYPKPVCQVKYRFLDGPACASSVHAEPVAHADRCGLVTCLRIVEHFLLMAEYISIWST